MRSVTKRVARSKKNHQNRTSQVTSNNDMQLKTSKRFLYPVFIFCTFKPFSFDHHSRIMRVIINIIKFSFIHYIKTIFFRILQKKLKILLNEIKNIFSQIISCKQAHAAGIYIKKTNYKEC